MRSIPFFLIATLILTALPTVAPTAGATICVNNAGGNCSDNAVCVDNANPESNCTGNAVCGINTHTCTGSAICAENDGTCTAGICGYNAAYSNCAGGTCVDNSGYCGGGICVINSGNCYSGICVDNTGVCNGGICVVNSGYCGWGGLCVINSGSCGYGGTGGITGQRGGTEPCHQTIAVTLTRTDTAWNFNQADFNTAATPSTCSTQAFSLDRSYSNTDSQLVDNGDSVTIRHIVPSQEGPGLETTTLSFGPQGTAYSQTFQDAFGQITWQASGTLTTLTGVPSAN